VGNIKRDTNDITPPKVGAYKDKKMMSEMKTLPPKVEHKDT